ncbi:hypothetical protein HELRODRAFT_171595 [Helobdella robusta]|uniref:Uncharacterized protein n=1 Tax=Helobdella robusta TaxID=6412 RepID=T1F4F8_HELRO|nr:hypothetical protein HELRODRAFT_171595 [Helobdella robusta]ESO05238.1 hypothetical protein HELRODRAFT_171595 [Helobdella robusta]
MGKLLALLFFQAIVILNAKENVTSEISKHVLQTPNDISTDEHKNSSNAESIPQNLKEKRDDEAATNNQTRSLNNEHVKMSDVKDGNGTNRAIESQSTGASKAEAKQSDVSAKDSVENSTLFLNKETNEHSTDGKKADESKEKPAEQENSKKKDEKHDPTVHSVNHSIHYVFHG